MIQKTNPKIRYRKMSPFEWIYLSASSDFPPFAIQLWIDAESLPSLPGLKDALGAAAAANPGARLVPEAGWWIDSEKTPSIRSIDRSESFSLSHPYFHEAFPLSESPPIEVLCWQGAGLIFRCSHVLMDAGGLLFFAEETFRALRGEPLLGSGDRISAHVYLEGFKHPMFRPMLLPNKKSPLGAPTNVGTGFAWERRTIPGHVSAVSAKLGSALARMTHSSGSSRLMLPVDLRQIDSSLRSTSNLSNALFPEIPAASSWTEVYCRIIDAFGRHDERATSRLDALFPWIPMSILSRGIRQLHDYQVRNDRYTFSATISHIGPVSLSAFSADGFTPGAVVLLPFDAPGSAITLITVQHENGLEIAASSPVATGSDGRLGVALDRLCATLQGKNSCFASGLSHTGYQSAHGPQVGLPRDLTVYALFVRQAQVFADRMALSGQGRGIPYGELERLAKLCACQLRKQGVRPGDRVAILSGRSSETIIALLGILRLGAAFVPLDPEWPQERIRFVLEDCRPACLLTDERHSSLADFSPCLPLSELAWGGDPEELDIAFNAAQESPAYVLYTSGSTGKPKGVVVRQRSLLNYLLWAQEAYLAGLDLPIVFPFFTSLAFDLTLTSLFLPLTTGGEIRIFSQADPLLAIRSILSDPVINAVKLTPSHLRIFAALGIENTGLRRFIVGGEALTTKLAKEISLQSTGRAHIFNEYGPTEATVGCVVHRFDFEHDMDAFVSIGNPIMNTEILLLDQDLSPVPDGQSGEIYISGECLALGYLGRPEENARFSPHPFRAGARIYRTGDRALRSQNGEFDYLGRMDEQIKVLGNRVELGEIEAAIEASGLCRACAVAPEDSANGTRLTAFVAWLGDSRETDLREAMAATLPTYMLPSRIVGLEQIPLNVNGKVDKSRLPGDHRPALTKTLLSDGEIESDLTEIVTGLTEGAVSPIPLDESLLDLGLDSLQMMLLLTAAARRFFPDLADDLLFSKLGEYLENPTIQNLALHLRNLTVDHRGGRA